jgi:hypothetical protein
LYRYHQVIRPARAMGYIGGKNRGGGDDLFHLTPYSKFQDLYHYQCAGHDDVLPPLVTCAAKGAKPKVGLYTAVEFQVVTHSALKAPVSTLEPAEM